MSSTGIGAVPAATVRQAQRLAPQRDALLATPTYFYDSLTGCSAWHRVGPGRRNLYEGPGRLLVDDVAEFLDVIVHPDSAV